MATYPNDQTLWKLLDLVGLKSRFEDNSQGLNTLIGENGINLSGGEKQRLAIVRAILRDTPIVLIDEATSALDKETELVVQNLLKESFANKTVIIIAHKLSALNEVNRIIVIEKGQIIADGKKDEVIFDSKIKSLLYMEDQ